jgi:hypothetical protein
VTDSYQADPAAPAGNPYGSFVSQPAPTPAYQHPTPASQPDPAYTAYNAPDQGFASNGWYGTPTPVAQPTAQPVPSLAPAAGSYLPNGQFANGHDMNGYPPGYQAPQPDAGSAQPVSYQGIQYDQLGYASPDAAYGPDGYQGYQGYAANGY